MLKKFQRFNKLEIFLLSLLLEIIMQLNIFISQRVIQTEALFQMQGLAELQE